MYNENNKITPVFQGHGDADSMVDLEFAKLANEVISSFNPNIKLNIYPNVCHSTNNKEMKELQEFIISIINKN